jgi:hypothetical protein
LDDGKTDGDGLDFALQREYYGAVAGRKGARVNDEDTRTDRALAIFASALRDPHKRKAIADNPETEIAAVLQSGDASIDDLPPKVQQFLCDLSLEELRFLSRFDATMREAGLVDDADAPFLHTKF